MTEESYTSVEVYGDRFVLHLSPDERLILGSLGRQLVDILAIDDDPVRARLLPDAYPEDAEASAEFRRLTRNDLIDARVAGAELLTQIGLDEDRILDRDEAETTMRSLGDLRQVVAERLGVSIDAPEPDAHHELTALYGWLGYLQECLVLAVIRHDEHNGRLVAGTADPE